MIRPALALAAFLAFGAAAQAADVVHVVPVPVFGVTRPCNDGKMLHDIADRFTWSQNNYFNKGVAIAGFDLIRQTGFAPIGKPGLMERRFCQAVVTLNTLERPTVYYLIESDAAFVGQGSRVEFCIEGFDRWHVHDGNCRTVRPQ